MKIKLLCLYRFTEMAQHICVCNPHLLLIFRGYGPRVNTSIYLVMIELVRVLAHLINGVTLACNQLCPPLW